jgi:hypothetical protein
VESKKPVEQLFASLYEFQGEGVGSNAILELLTVLPEEVIEDNTLNLTVDAERRWNFTQEVPLLTQFFEAVVIDFTRSVLCAAYVQCCLYVLVVRLQM